MPPPEPSGTDYVLCDQHEKRLDKIDSLLDKIRNRLPLWATLVIAGLTAALGWCVKG